MERKVLTTIRWNSFDGADGMQHPYLGVYALTITQTSEKTGKLYLGMYECDDGQNIPNEHSMETVRNMVKNLKKQVENGTFLSLEKNWAISDDPFWLVFELPNGVNFIEHAVALSFLIFQIFDFKIRIYDFDQVSIQNTVFVRESPDEKFVEETIFLKRQLN